MNKKVLLGMSGGVDSSVSAILLQKQGYEVIGATMRLWEKDGENNSIEDAKKVCEKLGIKHHTIDLREDFKKKVVDNFICTYMCAKTPNPCVECNKFMKFDAFYKIAKQLGCEYIATGHYAKTYYSEKYNQYVISKAEASQKDQSYFLYGIEKEVIPYIIFPLSEFNDKTEIRKIADENGLEVANKKDSQDVCFIQNNDYIGFIKNQNIKENINKQGNIILTNGEVVGRHTGIINYTIGQRKGLGISYKEPLYVIKLNRLYRQNEESYIPILAGEIKDKVTIKVAKASASAKEAIEKRPDNKAMEEGLMDGDIDVVKKNMVNVLEGYTLSHYKQVKETKEKMIEVCPGASVLMSGSGPSVFAVSQDREELERGYKELKEINEETYLTRTIV